MYQGYEIVDILAAKTTIWIIFSKGMIANRPSMFFNEKRNTPNLMAYPREKNLN